MDLANPNFDESLQDFLRMPIHLDRDHAASHRPHPPSARPGRRRSARRRARPPPDEGVDPRRRAFERSHAHRAARETDLAEKIWEADERFRKWKNSAANWKPDAPTLCREVDHRLIERVIGARGEHYFAMVRGSAGPAARHSVARVREVPRELHAFAEAPANRFYWGA
jgi:hypothetical protein